ncbi:MAG TPA: hypothetical protein VEQ63_11835 [Bryobacteraceae bacterium]|nr:hypothetical protein [Bryobacteraceae bacterium]
MIVQNTSLIALAAAVGCFAGEASEEPLLKVRRIYVDKLSGDQSAAQIRDMLVNALLSSRLFLITENPDNADASLKGSAEDLVFTDTFQSRESISARTSIGGASTTPGVGSSRGSLGVGIGQDEDTKIAERKHEAMAAVRLVNKTGDVIWATTQESLGAKFRGASADVADKVVKQLIADMERARRTPAKPGAEKPIN